MTPMTRIVVSQLEAKLAEAQPTDLTFAISNRPRGHFRRSVYKKILHCVCRTLPGDEPQEDVGRFHENIEKCWTALGEHDLANARGFRQSLFLRATVGPDGLSQKQQCCWHLGETDPNIRPRWQICSSAWPAELQMQVCGHGKGEG